MQPARAPSRTPYLESVRSNLSTVYDIAIAGAGPIGSATAYALSTRSNLSVAIVSREPADDPAHFAAYRWAGGSVRLYWDDPWKLAAVQATAGLARQLIAEGVGLDIIENSYLFLNRGQIIPGMNLAGAKLVRELYRRAVEQGITPHEGAHIDAVADSGDHYVLHTSTGDVNARRVLLALGAENAKLLPEYPVEFERRQVFVLDVPMEGGREKLPHLVLPFEDGVVFCFPKYVGGMPRLVVGQEDVIEHSDERAPEDYFAELLARGLNKALPFLKDATVLDILWGFDAKAKSPVLHTVDNRLFAANCGSAVRSSVLLGQEIAERLACDEPE